MPKAKTIAERLVVAREKKNYSQSQASEAWGINLKTLQAWEQGVNQPRGLYLKAVEAILKKAGV